ncbi:MAG: hypothetical protein H7Y15_07985, partial [Pseudonocardia sp.]|nr:hypothetical protein [Pseudonocardia sp.]
GLARRLDRSAAVGLAAYSRAHAAAIGAGYEVMMLVAERAADEMRPSLDTPEHDPDSHRVYGSLLLTASLGAATALRRERVDPYAAEAVEVARRIGDAPRAGDPWQTYFGPSNAAIWQMTIAADIGNAGDVLAHAATVDLDVLDSRPRRAAYWTELGRGLALMPGREDDAIEALLQAHSTSPARVATSRYVLGALDELLDRPLRRPSTRAKLALLARRLGHLTAA